VKEFKIGIVGGSGYIGSTLAKYLSKTFEVRVIDRNPLPREIQSKSVEHRFCDILKYEELERALKGLDAVIHTAIIQIPFINEQKKLGYKVNMIGTQNVCEVVDTSPSVKCMILAGTWHVFGERQLKGVIDEEFGFRPDKVEDRALLYAFSKMAQETTTRFYDEMSEKIYGIVRMGTVLGEGMPEKTAANIFISNGLKGKPLTPFKHSMYRPMLYVDINDVCKSFDMYISKIFNGKIRKEENSLAHVVNLCWPEPLNILDLTRLIRDIIVRLTKGRVKPRIEITDAHKPTLFTPKDKEMIKVDVSKLQKLIGLRRLTSPKESLELIVQNRMRLEDARNCLPAIHATESVHP
jgi:UDP-glucose 4-epimerase